MPVTGFELVGLIGAIKATADIIDNSIQALKAYGSAGNDADKLQLAFEADSAALKRFASILARSRPASRIFRRMRGSCTRTSSPC